MSVTHFTSIQIGITSHHLDYRQDDEGNIFLKVNKQEYYLFDFCKEHNLDYVQKYSSGDFVIGFSIDNHEDEFNCSEFTRKELFATCNALFDRMKEITGGIEAKFIITRDVS